MFAASVCVYVRRAYFFFSIVVVVADIGVERVISSFCSRSTLYIYCDSDSQYEVNNKYESKVTVCKTT